MSEPQPDAGELVRRAEALIDLRRYSEAMPLLQQAIAAAPQDAEPRCMTALALLHLRQFPEALRAAEEGAALSPEWEWPHRLRSIVLTNQGRRDEALTAAQEAVRCAPEEPYALHLLAGAQWTCGKREAARATGEHLRRIAPYRASSYELLAGFALEEKQFLEAEELAREALAIDPEAWQALHYLGIALRARKRLREAIDAFHSAARLNPSDPRVRENLYQAVRAYTYRGLRFQGLFLAFIAWLTHGETIPEPYRLWVRLGGYALVFLASAALFFWQQSRLKDLPPQVSDFYKHEEARRS